MPHAPVGAPLEDLQAVYQRAAQRLYNGAASNGSLTAQLHEVLSIALCPQVGTVTVL